MGNENQKKAQEEVVIAAEAEQNLQSPVPEASASSLDDKSEKASKKEKKAKEKKLKEEKKKKKKGKKEAKIDMTKVPAELQAMLNLDETDGNKEGETIFTKLVKVNMVGSGVALRAAITGHNGNVYAHSGDFVPTDDQIQEIAKSIHDPSPLAASGINLGDEHFYYTSSKPTVLRGKSKKDSDILCTVVSTRQLLLVGVYRKEKQDEAEDMMEALQTYFGDQGI